jgi:hypothetical protein
VVLVRSVLCTKSFVELEGELSAVVDVNVSSSYCVDQERRHFLNTLDLFERTDVDDWSDIMATD